MNIHESRNTQALAERGPLLIGPGTSLAPEWRLENDSVASDWSPLANTVTRRQLEKELASIGWTFFSMASPITTTSFGMSRPRMLDAALPRPIAAVRLERCKGLEIDDVGARSFLAYRTCAFRLTCAPFRKAWSSLVSDLDEEVSSARRPSRHAETGLHRRFFMS